MVEQQLEDCIMEALAGEAQRIALEFAAYLRANEMQSIRAGGYWQDQLYWMVTYQGEYVCFILLDGHGPEEQFAPWTIWSDDTGSQWFADFQLDEHTKEIAWKNVDICGNCGGCDNPGGSSKMIFGREFDNVCRTTLRFIHPDAEAVECVKKMVELRKKDIFVPFT